MYSLNTFIHTIYGYLSIQTNIQTTTNIARKTLYFKYRWFSHVSVTMFDLVIACADQCFDSRVNKA